VRSTNPLASAEGIPLGLHPELCRFYCESVSLQNEKKTQAPNHVVIRLHDGAIKQRWDLKYTVMIRIFTG
jgi:hypothetical protein